jgi:trehalose 6-phosphate synthase/phosphatase
LGLESSPKGVEYNGSQVSIRIFPAGIDVDEVKKFTQTPSVLEKLANFKEMFSNKKVILGRDKTDQVNGVKHKLLAFEKFLQMFPEYRNKIVLVQVTSPPPNELPKIASQVTELVSKINAQFGSLEFTPVRHFHQHLDQEEYIALLKLADVALVTSVRDSMNATCLEFIVCQEEGHSPLILSEFSGTAGSLSASLLVNPWDYKGVAQTMHDALSMSREEKANRHQQLYDQVVCHSASYWSHNFVKELVFYSLIILYQYTVSHD